MEKHVGEIKAAVVLGLSAITARLGVLAVPLGLLVVCSVMDYATGLMAAPFRGQVRSSYKGLRGIIKKLMLWTLVAVGVVIDITIRYLTEQWDVAVPFSFVVATVVCVWLVANELLSILENVSDAGVPVPPLLKPAVKWLKDKAEKKSHALEDKLDPKDE